MFWFSLLKSTIQLMIKIKFEIFFFPFFLFRNRLNLTEFMKYARFLLFFNCSSHVIPVFSSSLFIKQMNFIGNTRLSNDYIFFFQVKYRNFLAHLSCRLFSLFSHFAKCTIFMFFHRILRIIHINWVCFLHTLSSFMIEEKSNE